MGGPSRDVANLQIPATVAVHLFEVAMSHELVLLLVFLPLEVWLFYVMVRSAAKGSMEWKDVFKVLSDVADGKSPLPYPPESEKYKEAEKVGAG